jgi:transposase
MIESLPETCPVVFRQRKAVMEGTSLFALPEGFFVEQIQIAENHVVVEAVATSATARCPLCGEPSSSAHCHYHRRLRDVPCVGRRVQLVLDSEEIYLP